MAIGSVITQNGYKILIDRGYNTTPTLTAPSNFRTGTGTTTPAVTDTAIQTPIGSDTAVVTGFPTFNTASQSAIMRGLSDTTDLNGNTISEFGFKNTDGTPLLFNHAVINGIVKNSLLKVAWVLNPTISNAVV